MSAQIFLNYRSHGISNCLTKAKEFQKSCEKFSSKNWPPFLGDGNIVVFRWHWNEGTFTEIGL